MSFSSSLPGFIFFSLTVSLIVALTLVPVMSYQLMGLAGGDRRAAMKVSAAAKAMMDGLERGYRAAVDPRAR